MIDLEPIKARLAAATPGPWLPDPMKMFIYSRAGMIASESHGSAGDVARGIQDGDVAIRGVGAGLPMDANHDLIVSAPTDLAALVAEVEQLRAQIDCGSACTEAGKACKKCLGYDLMDARNVASECSKRESELEERAEKAERQYANLRALVGDVPCTIAAWRELTERAEKAEAERDARPAITGEEAYTWIGCKGGPTERKVHATLKAFGLRWAQQRPEGGDRG